MGHDWSGHTTTEPQAQEESTMNAGKGIIWAKDEKGKRTSIAYQDVEAYAYKTVEQFTLQLLARAGIKPEDYDPDAHEVVCVPFGG